MLPQQKKDRNQAELLCCKKIHVGKPTQRQALKVEKTLFNIVLFISLY